MIEAKEIKKWAENKWITWKWGGGQSIYLDCMKYHSITIGGGGGQQNITLYHKGWGGGLEGVNFVSRDKWTAP